MSATLCSTRISVKLHRLSKLGDLEDKEIIDKSKIAYNLVLMNLVLKD